MQGDFQGAVSAMRRSLDQLEKQLAEANQTASPIMRHCHLTEANNTATAITGIFEWLRHDIEADRSTLFAQIKAAP